VVVVDSQPLFLEALASLLGRPPLNAVTRTASSSIDALALLGAGPVDVVLCNLRVHPAPFRSFLGSVRELPQAPPIILLADCEDEDALVDEIDTEVAALFTKDTQPEQFLDGVRAVLAGHRAIGANVLRRLVGRLNGSEPSPHRPGLTQLSPTELDILIMVGAASSVEQIALARGISQKTVRNHLANIYRKLELRSRTEAMLCAARMGLTGSQAPRRTRDKCPDLTPITHVLCRKRLG
jgi:DNA-binding NarL/FixJ family response regulator